MPDPESEPVQRVQPAQATNVRSRVDQPEADARVQLEALIRKTGCGYAEVSRLIGRNAAYVQQYIKRGIPRRLAEPDRRRLALHFGVQEAVLGGPDAVTLLPAPVLHLTQDVPFLDGRTTTLSIDSALLERVHPGTDGRAKLQIAAHQMQGDSMAPTLLAGDHLLVDLADCGPARDGIYVIDGDSAPLVKRLSVNPVSRRVAILSDNAAYTSFPDCDPAEIRMLGRVIWVGRALP